MRTLSRALRKFTHVQPVSGEFHQCVGQATIPRPVVVPTRSAGQRLQGCAQHGAALRIEETFEKQRSIVARLELERARLHHLDLLGEVRARIGCMASVGTVVAEAADAVRLGLLSKSVSSKPAAVGDCTTARAVFASSAR